MKDILELNELLNEFEWGYPDENGTNIVDTDDFEHYRLLSNNDFLKYKMGTCWDYTNYEAIWFLKHGFVHSMRPLTEGMFCCYYIEDETEQNHTWLAFMKNEKVYSFESSWKQYVGVNEYQNEFEMMRFYADTFKFDSNSLETKLWKYMRFPCIDMDPYDFMQHIRTNGKQIKKKLKKRY